DVLLRLSLHRRNIVLDSLYPEIAPHIVISPPDVSDAWDLYYAVLINRIGPQQPGYLAVPRKGDNCELRACMFASGPERHAPHNEKSPMDGCLSPIPRAKAASSAALSFRARWDVPYYPKHFEKPFRWSDPADALLSFFSHCPQTLVIDSSTPYTTPHIVIQEPPPENLWVLHQNNTPNPQDFAYGDALTVPSSFVQFVNHPSELFDEDSDGCIEDQSLDDESLVSDS
ncbi:hypothetical protein WOLCODRAFT_55818, partial [Wolfiporia cocos MD-104 SS10]